MPLESRSINKGRSTLIKPIITVLGFSHISKMGSKYVYVRRRYRVWSRYSLGGALADIVYLFLHGAENVEKDNDFADRLSSRYTVTLLTTFAVTVFVLMVTVSTISCWSPAHFIGSHKKYANSYCWVRNTYYLPFYEEIPQPHEER